MKKHSRSVPLSLAGLFLLALITGTGVQGAVTAGGFAVVGYTDNATTDSFSIVALETITANQVLYITNNGWSNAGQSFDGASPSGEFGAGAEQLMRLELTSNVVAGTIIGSDWNMGYKLTGDIGYSGVGLEGVGSCFVLVFSLACWTAQVEWGSGWLRA